MTQDETFKFPRLYVDVDLGEEKSIALAPPQAHYFRTVLRRQDGDPVRLFNGRDGEWLGHLQNLSKKAGEVKLEKQLKSQPQGARRIHLFFAPIKKHRMDWLIEKAVELGATDFHPILTQNTETRKINEERMQKQIFEAAEQCERLAIPALHPLETLEIFLQHWPENIPILACLERFNAPPLSKETSRDTDLSLLIGPEGGFTSKEKEKIAKMAIPVSLGDTILRCETAAIKALILTENTVQSPLDFNKKEG